jgi:hypothetical protein
MNASRLLTLVALLGFHFFCKGQSFGIGTDNPDASSILDVSSSNRGILIPRISIADANDAAPVSAPAISLLVYNTNVSIANGKGTGYYYWEGSKWTPLLDYPSVKNGLTYSTIAEGIKLGGDLSENTTINLDNFDFTYNLNNSGNFIVQESGNTKLRIHSNGHVSISGDNEVGDFNVNGTSYFSNDITLRRNDVNTGDDLVILTNQANNGVINVYENDNLNHIISGKQESVFNEQGLNNADVRFESDNRNEALLVDTKDDVIRIGNPAGGTLQDNGVKVYDAFGALQADIDYVLHTHNNETTGTAIGLGSKEYLVDGNSETLFSDILSPTTNMVVDLGWSNSWDDIYADNFVNISDQRAKSNVKNINYGLKEILKLRPVSYTLNQDPFKETKLGLIAQETLRLIPEVVKTHEHKILNESGDYEEIEMKLMRMTYIQLIPVLIKAIQEQQTQIEEIKIKNDKSIENLQLQVNELKAFNAELLQKLNQLIAD